MARKRKERPGFMIYWSDWDSLQKELSDAEMGKLLKSVYSYNRDGIRQKFEDRLLRTEFDRLADRGDADKVRYAETCEKRSVAGKKGGEAKSKNRKQKVANGTNCKQKVAKLANTKANSNSITTEDIEDGFDEFWKVYPVKKAKDAARKAFAKAVKIIPLPDMMTILRKQVDAWSRTHTDFQYFPYPSTWLNECRWTDEIQEQTEPISRPDYGIHNYTSEELNNLVPVPGKKGVFMKKSELQTEGGAANG